MPQAHLMTRKTFTFQDFSQDCELSPSPNAINHGQYGLSVRVPEALRQQWPYNATAYDFMQFFRQPIQQYGFIEFPDLPVNKSNYTLAQRSPREHSYSTNTYMTDFCQQPHQDTPPYPTAFWLDQPRAYFATWLLTSTGVQEFMRYKQHKPHISLDDLHKVLVPQSLKEGWGSLVNRQSGLILIDNSQHCALYHARTCNFLAIADEPDFYSDAAMYAFNEMGLLHYIDELDSRRGKNDRDEQQMKEITVFMQQEQLT